MSFEFTDRYQALGIPYPNPDTVCQGQCEGTGLVPIHKDEDDPVFKALWIEADKVATTDDGWHFVKCPDCHGRGKKAGNP